MNTILNLSTSGLHIKMNGVRFIPRSLNGLMRNQTINFGAVGSTNGQILSTALCGTVTGQPHPYQLSEHSR